MNCAYCKEKLPSVSSLITHIRKSCSKVMLGEAFKCGEAGCFRSFSCLKSLRWHLKKKHCQNSEIYITSHDTSSRNIESKSTIDEPTTSFDSLTVNVVNEVVPINSCKEKPNAQNPTLLKLSEIISSLYVNPMVPRNTVQIVVNFLIDYFGHMEKVHFARFQQLCETQCIPPAVKAFVSSLISSQHLEIVKLHSEHLRFSYFQEIGTYIIPDEVVVGSRLDCIKQEGLSNTEAVNCTMQLFPMSLILAKFFSTGNVLEDTLNHLEYLKSLPSTSLDNVINGTVWRQMSLSFEHGVHHFPIVLYYDDYEISNPLGSRAGVHKLGGVYISLPCLPPYYFSLLNCIFTLAIFHTTDRVTFGNKLIFQKVIDSLNSLHRTGIQVKTDVYEGTIKFHLVAITGDNLGLHSMLGFVENFSATYHCRICKANKAQSRSMLYEDVSLLRDNCSYESDLALDNVSETGIKEKCIWLAVDNFDLFNNVSTDILHDYLEGVCRYVMTFVVTYLVTESKLLPLPLLNAKISSFNYGPDNSSKPCDPVSIPSGKPLTLKLSASEMLTFVRYFGLLFGYYVPTLLPEWQLFITLRTLLDKLLITTLDEGNIDQVKVLVADLNELYLKYSKSHLKPKFHYLIHYPGMLKKFGPLTQLWTMRFEAKHKIAKLAARSSFNKRNICKTIAIRNQLILNDIFLKDKILPGFSTGKKSLVTSDVIASFQPSHDYINSVPWVKYKGTHLRIMDVISVRICSETCHPIFAIIDAIFVNENSEVYLQCTYFESIDFDYHYHAYEVTRTNKTDTLSMDSILSPIPNTLTIMPNLTLFVTIRSSLD